MRGKITALVAAAAAAAGATSAAIWARGRKGEAGSGRDAAGTPAVAPPAVGPDESVAEPTAEPALAADAADDFTAIKGLGKVKAAKLVAAGVISYAQIAAWTDEDIAEYGLQTNTSPGQIKREDWVGQARVLADG